MGSFVSEPMIFVTGASRSGTTLLSQILGKHSSIAGLAELQYFGEFCDPRRDSPHRPVDRREAVETMFTREIEGILAPRGRRCFDPGIARVLESLPEEAGAAETFAATVGAFAARRGKSMPCEQTPRNIYYASALLDWYPRARFVHMLRDPRGVVASQKFRWRRRSLMADPSKMSYLQQLRTRVNYHPVTITQLWKLATQLALALQDHPRFHLLRLEDLILEPERRLREVCDFLEVAFEPDMLDIDHINSSHVSKAQAAKGLSRDAIDAWRGKLTRDELATVHRRCASLMERVGYTSEPVTMSRTGRLVSIFGYPLHLVGAALINPRRSLIQGRALLRGLGRRRQIRQPSGECGEDPAPGAAHLRCVHVFGLPFMDVPLARAARYLVDCAAAGVRRRVVFVNAHSLNVSVQDPDLQEALTAADVVYADGVGMAMAARLQGVRLVHNVNGTDLFPHLCREAGDAGVPIALLGAAPGVVETCARVLARDYPNLQVGCFHHGFLKPADVRHVIDRINASGARILLVAMGVPRQERWIMEHAGELRVPVIMGVGGLFDFVSGRVPRAPLALRKMRMEWLFRLLVEPRRLFGRYVIGNPRFLARACRYAVTGHLSSQTSREATSR